jgi:hypothetical protein
MKMTRILTSVAGLFRPTSGNTLGNHQSASPETDGIHYCYSLRHGGTRIQRNTKARGISASGIEFEIIECPECGRFATVTRDPITAREAILFSGKHYREDYASRPQRQQHAPFRPIRTGHAAA